MSQASLSRQLGHSRRRQRPFLAGRVLTWGQQLTNPALCAAGTKVGMSTAQAKQPPVKKMLRAFSPSQRWLVVKFPPWKHSSYTSCKAGVKPGDPQDTLKLWSRPKHLWSLTPEGNPSRTGTFRLLVTSISSPLYSYPGLFSPL